MDLMVDRPTAKQATVKWNTVPQAEIYEVVIKDSGCLSNSSVHTIETSLVLDKYLVLGTKYTVTIKAMKNYSSLIEASIHFRTEFTAAELKELHDKAVKFMGSYSGIVYDQITWFYRDKPDTYMNNILTNKNGLMEVYTKDNNGDQASIINGEIKGLFFATFIQPRTGQPVSSSVFGPSRLSVPAEKMLEGSNVRLYFADFYCIHLRHHATLVLTHRGTDVDDFCSDKLIELDRHSNDFLTIDRLSNVVKVSCRELYVEVLYTENIDIHEWERSRGASRSRVPIKGRGTSTPGGLRKKSSCTVCNLNSVSASKLHSLFNLFG